MELVYLWVEEYQNIKAQGNNVSYNFDFNYNEKINKLYDLKIPILHFTDESLITLLSL